MVTSFPSSEKSSWKLRLAKRAALRKPSLIHFCSVLWFLLSLSVLATAQVNVYTRSYDNARTGANLQETILTPANVSPTTFGKLFTVHTDGEIYAQPLYVSNLAIAGGTHNVVFVATMFNSVYAIDADNGAVLWTMNYGSPMIPQDVEIDQNIVWSTKIGIIGTPVIDPATNIMYFVSCLQPADGTLTFSFALNAIDITTGLPVGASPVAIAATYNTADLVTPMVFSARKQNPRPGLALGNGNVYITFASHEDQAPYHGWVLGYSTSTLAQTAVYSDTTIGDLGGIWCAGQAPTLDSAGNIYISTGNGSFGKTPNNLVQTGNSFIKLSPSLQLLDYFTPYNSATLNMGDTDLGSSGLLLIPNTTYLLGGGKQGILYLDDTTGMGGFNAATDQVRQEFQAVYGQGTSHIHGGPVYFDSAVNGPSIFNWGENDVLRDFLFDSTAGLVTTKPFAVGTFLAPVTNHDGAMPGGFLSISANGNTNGILWASTPFNGDAVHQSVEGVVYAYDANTLNLLWNDKFNEPRDEIGLFAKYVPPVVANGKMYLPNFGPVGTTDGSGNLVVYGLLKPATPVLTVTANNAARSYGAANPTFTGTVTGQQGSDTFTESFATTAIVSSNVGTYPIVPSVTGTNVGNYTVTPVNGVLTVNAEATATALNAPSTAAPGASITLTSTVTAGYGTPAGTVTFYSGATSLGTGTLSGTGEATLTTTALPTGTDAVTAVYAAAGNFATSTSTVTNVVVSAGAQTITFPAIAPHAYGSAPFAVTATSSLGSGYPVTIAVQSGPATITGGNVTVTGVGAVVLKATQPGDANHSAASATQSFQATPAPLSVTATNATRAYGAANPTFTGTVTGAVGSDTFTETYSTTATTTSNVGSYPIVPAVTGAAIADYTVTLVNGTLTVTGAPTTTNLTAPATAVDGAGVALTATVASTVGTAAGTVTFKSGSTVLGTGTLSGGVASLSITTLPVGTDSVTASYAAAGNFAASTSPPVTVTISPAIAPSWAVAASPTALTITAGQSGTTTLTVTPSGGYAGTIAWSCAGLPSNATCSFAQSQLSLTASTPSASTVLTINTTVQQAQSKPTPSPLLALAFWWPGSLTGLMLFARRRKLALLCLFVLVAGLAGCGGGSMSGGGGSTTPVTSQVTLTATGTAGTVVTTKTITLTLNMSQ
jgi:Bacterial Ig-like domain (group 3)/MBG domain (YGX type)/PQQ enzyme repeat